MIDDGGMDGAADDQLRQSGFFGDAPGNVTIVVASLKPSRVIRGVRVVVVVVVVVVDVLVDVGAKHSNVVLGDKCDVMFDVLVADQLFTSTVAIVGSRRDDWHTPAQIS